MNIWEKLRLPFLFYVLLQIKFKKGIHLLNIEVIPLGAFVFSLTILNFCFLLHFFYYEWCWASFHMFICIVNCIHILHFFFIELFFWLAKYTRIIKIRSLSMISCTNNKKYIWNFSLSSIYTHYNVPSQYSPSFFFKSFDDFILFFAHLKSF